MKNLVLDFKTESTIYGAAALILSEYPNLTPQEIKQRILNNVTKSDGLTDKVSSGGYLNIYTALCNDQVQAQELLSLNINEHKAELTIQEKKQLIAETKDLAAENDKTKEFFVKFADASQAEEILTNALSEIEFEVVKQFKLSKAFFVRTNSVSDADAAIDRLNEMNTVEYAAPNYYISNQSFI